MKYWLDYVIDRVALYKIYIYKINVVISYNQGSEVLSNAYFFLISLGTFIVRHKFVSHFYDVVYEILFC